MDRVAFPEQMTDLSDLKGLGVLSMAVMGAEERTGPTVEEEILNSGREMSYGDKAHNLETLTRQNNIKLKVQNIVPKIVQR